MKKDWREREMTMEIVVGAFMVMIFLGLGYFTIILSKEALFRATTEMRITFSNVMGLRMGDNVVVRGMPVGKVKALELTSTPGCAGVCATLTLDKPITMREGYTARIVTTSILGGRQLQIDEGPSHAPALELDLYSGSDPYDLMGDAAEIVNAARNQIIEGQVFEKIREMTDQISGIVARVNAGKGTLGRLLSDDETIYNDIAQTTASLKTVAARIEQGEGTLGRFMSDDSLYNEIEATVGEIRAAVDDFRETAPITTFSSIFFGAF